jgi:hypothetical protein
LDPAAGLDIDVDHEQLRSPVRDRGLRLIDGPCQPAEMASVSEGEIDGVGECPVVDDEEPRGSFDPGPLV